jgi:cation transport ATPase
VRSSTSSAAEGAFKQSPESLIRTPWGDLSPRVDLLPLIYILILYGVVYFLPFGIFDAWRKGEDGPAEWIHFLGYAGAFLSGLVVLWRRRRRLDAQWVFWLLLTVFCFYVAGEEISWGERMTGLGLEAVREINAQKETNVHNIPAIQNYLHFSFIAAGLFFGWFGWRFWPGVEAFPSRWYSLYFLAVALFYAYWDLSWITLGDRIRNDQEAIEVLMASGLFLHAFHHAFPRFRPRQA